MTTTPGALMRAEIAEQPSALQGLLDHRREITAVADLLRRRDLRYVTIAARGSSDHAALYAKYLVETVLGLPCGLASMSSITAYRADQDYRGVLWLAVSQSGGSPDLTDATTRARAAGATTVAVTNERSSPLADAAELHVDLRAGVELSVAATKTYTNELLALWLLVDALAGRGSGAADALPAAVAATIGLPAVDEIVQRYRFAERVVTVGRGFSYPTAREGALKLMETCHLAATAFSGADLLHGPVAHLESSTPVVIVAPGSVGAGLLAPVVASVQERGADVTVVAPPHAGLAARTIQVPDVLEELSPLVQIVPLQSLSLGLALARSLDPDRPRGLSKVTCTL